MALLIKNGEIITADSRARADILCEGETITRIGAGLDAPPGAEVIDGIGYTVLTVASAQLILATAVSGWSPNSPATCAAQPRAPSCRSVVVTVRRIWSAEGDPEGCRDDRNNAPARTAGAGPGISPPGSDVFRARISAIVGASLPSAVPAY